MTDSTHWHTYRLAVVLACAFCCNACTTTTTVRTVAGSSSIPQGGALQPSQPALPIEEITINPDGTATVRGRTVPTRELGKKLQNLDVNKRTGLRVILPKDYPPASVQSLGSQLATAGYRGLSFGKRKTEVEVGPKRER